MIVSRCLDGDIDSEPGAKVYLLRGRELRSEGYADFSDARRLAERGLNFFESVTDPCFSWLLRHEHKKILLRLQVPVSAEEIFNIISLVCPGDHCRYRGNGQRAQDMYFVSWLLSHRTTK